MKQVLFKDNDEDPEVLDRLTKSVWDSLQVAREESATELEENGRSDKTRRIAILITDLEKAYVWASYC